MDKYTCDSCGSVVLSPKNDITEAVGFHGVVQLVALSSASGRVDWFACTRVHIENAVINALKKESEK